MAIEAFTGQARSDQYRELADGSTIRSPAAIESGTPTSRILCRILRLGLRANSFISWGLIRELQRSQGASSRLICMRITRTKCCRADRYADDLPGDFRTSCQLFAPRSG